MADPLTCIVFALGREAMFFRRALTGRQTVAGAPCPAWLARAGERRVLVLIAGMGSAAAGRALAWALGGDNPTGRPDRAVSAGFCGGLSEDARVGALIQPAEIVDSVGCRVTGKPRGCNPWGTIADPSPTPNPGVATPGLDPTISPNGCTGEDSPPRLTQPWHEVLTGRLVTVAAPVLTCEARQALHRRCGAAAVDMESATLALMCQEAGVPFACLRAVSDDVRSPLSPALSAALDGDRVRLPRLLAAVLRRPLLALELMRLARHSRIAAVALAQGLLHLL